MLRLGVLFARGCSAAQGLAASAAAILSQQQLPVCLRPTSSPRFPAASQVLTPPCPCSSHSAARRDDLLPHAVSALWRVLTDPPEGGGIAQQIDQAVHEALAQQRDEELLQRQAQAPAARTGT